MSKLYEALADLANARQEAIQAGAQVNHPMNIEFEFADGVHAPYTAENHADAWDLVRLVDPTGDEIVSAWRDGEPWFGACTDMRPGVP